MHDDLRTAGAVFFDTNVLLYLFDRRSNEKRRRASELFNKHQQNGTLRMSAQVVNEFAANLLSKQFAVSRMVVAGLVRDLLTFQVIGMEGEDTLTALRLIDQFGMSFRDALILASARTRGLYRSLLGKFSAWPGLRDGHGCQSFR